MTSYEIKIKIYDNKTQISGIVEIEASESKWVNLMLNINGVNSLRL